MILKWQILNKKIDFGDNWIESKNLLINHGSIWNENIVEDRERLYPVY